ncbi:MAG TPA: hypothetical protein VLW84_13865 [Terriglobales bacterium]|nr:hypothetical protein [Terriglobales bacterium]
MRVISPLKFRATHFSRQGSRATTCYALRSYLVVRDDPGSDSTTASGYSTCQLDTRFHVKDAFGGSR